MTLVWSTPPLALNGESGTESTNTVSGFVRLAVHTANQSDSSFVKRHEKITSLVWPDQSDSRFSAGSLSLIVCVRRPLRRLYQTLTFPSRVWLRETSMTHAWAWIPRTEARSPLSSRNVVLDIRMCREASRRDMGRVDHTH